VIAKQWMWKFYYPGAQREIDSLHVPVGRPVRLTIVFVIIVDFFFSLAVWGSTTTVRVTG